MFFYSWGNIYSEGKNEEIFFLRSVFKKNDEDLKRGKKNLIFHEKGIKKILNSSPSKIFIINLTFLQIKETHHTHKKIIQSNKTHTMDRKVGLSFAKKAPHKSVCGQQQSTYQT